MVNCFMLLDPKQTFSLKVVKTYIIQLRLSLQAPHSHPLTPEMARTFRRFPPQWHRIWGVFESTLTFDQSPMGSRPSRMGEEYPAPHLEVFTLVSRAKWLLLFCSAK
jgi:hypothetical protein